MNASAVNQPMIVNAVWDSLAHGRFSTITDIAKVANQLSPELQVYLRISIETGRNTYADIEQWKDEFDAKEIERATDQASQQKQSETLGYGIASAVAVAVNAWPVVGQALSAVISLGIAISKAIVNAFPLPVRKADDHIFDALEGFDIYRGLRLASTPASNIFANTKEIVEEDPLMLSLPSIPTKTRFKFAPTTDAFRTLATEQGLYRSEYYKEALARVCRAC